LITIKQYIPCVFLQVIIYKLFIVQGFCLPFSISMLFKGSLFRFPRYLQAPFFDFYVISRLPFSIYLFFIGSLFQFTCYLQAPFFHLHVIYRLPFSIYMLFIGSLFRFTCYLQAPFFDLHVLYRLLFSFSMFFTASLFLFTCYLQYFGNLPVLNLPVIYRFPGWITKFTGYLQYLEEQFTCYLHDLSPLLWNIYSVFFIIYMFHLKYLHVFHMKPPKHVKGGKSCKLFFTVFFWLFTC